MTGASDVRNTDQTREMVLYAAVAELAAKNVGAFNLEGVAARAGIDVLTIKQLWASAPELFTAALLAFAKKYMPIPDTGTLRGDMLQYAKSYALCMNSPIGRRLLDTLIVKPEDWDVAGSREHFLAGRREALTGMVCRAIERGECTEGTDPVLLIDMLSSCLGTPLLFYDLPVTDEHCEYVVELMLNGVLRR